MTGPVLIYADHAADIAADLRARCPAEAVHAIDQPNALPGALEIFALRELLRQARGDRFDLKEFHQLILQQGSVPLSLLRQQVERAGPR